MNNILDLYAKHPVIKNKTGKYRKANSAFIQTLIAKDFLTEHQNLFVVLPNLYEAQKYYDALSEVLGNEEVLFYPADQTLTAMMALGSPEFKNERMYTLRQLLKKDRYHVIVTTQQGVLQRQLKPSDYFNSVKTLSTGVEYNLESLVTTLTYNGYKNNYIVERPGDFSVRGSILDIFTHDNANPYRLDFFGDELETIKNFDVETQKSYQNTNEMAIAPLSELFYTQKHKNEAIEAIKQHFSQLKLSEKEALKLSYDLENLDSRNKLDSLGIYLNFFNPEITTILDFSPKHKIYTIDLFKMEVNEVSAKSDLMTYAQTMEGEAFLNLVPILPLDYLKKQPLTTINLVDLDQSALDLKVTDLSDTLLGLDLLNQTLSQYGDYTKILAVINLDRQQQLLEYLNDKKLEYTYNQINSKQINVVSEYVSTSFVDSDNKIVVISESQIFNQKLRGKIRYRSVINQAIKVRDVSELNLGDYVVHYDFGIGQYRGLVTMELSGIKRDYLHLIYQNDEYLYVPVDQIELVLKYRSYDDLPPKLSKLGSKQWTNTKNSVKKKIRDMSDHLLKIYAERNAKEGYAFSRHDVEMRLFESDFGYQETKDQQLAIDKMLADMEQTRPMDRLIAGDVGFGKTEVALRAAYKCVLDAKQVAYLVPTTVLARQHYYTFKERFEKYGANVALLSRFVSKREINETIEKLNKGLIDVVIGTHRLLSDDVKFKDLGLFIIDEEQRFGVEHKEKIKEIKVNVDTLTLSATPIPRTLQMAIYGIKDLSMIDTPPLNRYPVQTYVVERQDALIKEAIERELARAGQVFYLYNKVADIEKIAAKLNRLTPHAKIGIAHGKMTKEKLEEVLTSFIDREFDVLVSTTIIETGVDIPNSNTLIIHDADKLGLAQLYQIRGRVGRSDRIAYAYLMYDPFKNINDEAKKRLSVIEDFTDLGSGFKIAMRDLAIRGSGDILGAEQSGFIDSVGMDLYMKLLDEVMTNQETNIKPVVDEVYAQRHISKEYIDNDAVRIEIHKRISAIATPEQLEDLKIELMDRFGNFDEELITYMNEKLFKKLSAQLGVEKSNITANSVELILNENGTKRANGEKLFILASNFNPRVNLNFVRGKIQIMISIRNQSEHWLKIAIRFLNQYLNE